jgi:UDP-N-acetylglucosamine--N-acetylmuramyl-(pentapeptide) pyrophosphoryl-undecaprenol N-acetylglucosamine transferase
MIGKAPRILIAGGGTGGHVYPAIAIADALRVQAEEIAIAFAGTQDRLEWRAVPQAGYPIHPITVQGFHRKQPMRNLAFPFKLARGLMQSWSLVGAFDPDVVVGTGGFVAGPVLYAAHRRNRPVVIQEQNAFPGITNKLLGRYARRIHLAFSAAERYFDASRCRLSGNPTRASLRQIDRQAARRAFEIPEGSRVLLVFGGSLGSAAINAAMEKHLAELLEDPTGLVIWQTGSGYFDDVRSRVADHPQLRLLKYIENMDQAYGAADLALVRAGALTCSELMVTGTPAILAPSPNVAEDHQTQNARSMEAAGAARMVPDEALLERLPGEVRRLLNDEPGRREMAKAALALARPHAARDIARDILEMIGAT